jgi:hypothetical protein
VAHQRLVVGPVDALVSVGLLPAPKAHVLQGIKQSNY